MVMDIAQHPVDPNLLFLAYEGSLLWHINFSGFLLLLGTLVLWNIVGAQWIEIVLV